MGLAAVELRHIEKGTSVESDRMVTVGMDTAGYLDFVVASVADSY